MCYHFDHEFSSLEKAIDGLNMEFGNNFYDEQILDWETDKTIETRKIPYYLFRGESGVYNSTQSTRGRLDEKFGENWTNEKEHLTKLLIYCSNFLERVLCKPSPLEILAFMQHYGLPTACLDLTSDLEVAGYFSSFGEVNEKKVIGVFSVKDIIKNKRRLVDLKGGRLGQRPEKQKGFILFQKVGDDYKSTETRDLLNIKWFSYILTKYDKEKYYEEQKFLSVSDDCFMGILPLLIREFERDFGPIHKNIRAENIDQIPDIPLVINHKGHVIAQSKFGDSICRIMNSNILTKMNIYRKSK